LGGDSAECTALDRPLPERFPLVLARLGSPMPSATPEPESADEQAVPYSPADIADMLASLSNIWLPMMYGFSGAIVAALRTIYRKVSASTLAPWDIRLLWTRMVLARLSQLAARNPEMGRFSAAGCRKVGTTARISFCYRNTIRGDPGRRLAG
jgi:hypothetical protein